jgi:hypothetical protein
MKKNLKMEKPVVPPPSTTDGGNLQGTLHAALLGRAGVINPKYTISSDDKETLITLITNLNLEHPDTYEKYVKDTPEADENCKLEDFPENIKNEKFKKEFCKALKKGENDSCELDNDTKQCSGADLDDWGPD